MAKEFEKIRNLVRNNWDFVEEGIRTYSKNGLSTVFSQNLSYESQKIFTGFWVACSKKDAAEVSAFLRLFHKHLPKELTLHITRLMQRAVNIKEK